VIISPAYAQAAAPQGGIDGSFMIMMVGMIIFMYFLVFRPQMKRQKEHKAMMEGLQKGDEVIAAGGMLGRITALADAYMTIEIAPGTEIRVQRASVVTLLPKGTIKSI
jgi:preprotein translocase subunit YajC